jgi:hypothetical protein
VVVQGVVVDPEDGVPDRVRRHRQDGKILVMFYGPPYNKVLRPTHSFYIFLKAEHWLSFKKTFLIMPLPKVCHLIRTSGS